MGFVDKDNLRKLTEQATDALRHLGLTVEQAGYSVNPETGDMALHITAIVRETAHEKLVTDQQQNASFNTMLAQQAEEKRRKQMESIAQAMASGNVADALTKDEEECSHANSVEGLCLDCGKEADLYG